MRKLLAGTLAIIALSIFVQPALSKPAHPIQGHDAAEVAGFCGAVGGSFGIWDSPGGGIVFTCTWGPTQSQQVSCKSSGSGAKGMCVSNYEPGDPREPRLPPPKGKKGGASKNKSKPTDKVNTTAGLGNTRNFGSTPPKPPAKANVTGGATTASGAVTPASTIARSGVTAAPATPSPAKPAPALGGGAFGGSMSPTMLGPAGVPSRKLP